MKSETKKKNKTWRDITIEQVDLLNVVTNDTIISGDEKTNRTLAILANRTLQELKDLTIVEYNELLNEYSFVQYEINPYIPSSPKLTINSTPYEINMDLSGMTMGQFMDIQQYLKSPYIKYQDLLSCLIIPTMGKYGDDMTKVRNDIKTIDAITGISIVRFFFLCIKNYNSSIPLSSDLTTMMKSIMKMN